MADTRPGDDDVPDDGLYADYVEPAAEADPYAELAQPPSDDDAWPPYRRSEPGLPDYPAGAPTRLPAHAPEPRRSRKKLFAGLLVAVVLVGGGTAVVANVAGGFLHLRGTESAPDYAGPGTTEVLVTVANGDSPATLAHTLVVKGVIKSAAAFTQVANRDSRSTTLQPGIYRLKLMMTGAAAFDAVLDTDNRVGHVTIPEGMTVQATLQLIADKGDIPLADLQAAVANPTTLNLPDASSGNPEGFLFPATYDFNPDAGAVEALRQLTQQYTVRATGLDLVNAAAAKNITPREAVIVASLIEREDATADAAPKVARVIYNRLKIGQTLGLESTLRYANGNTTAQNLQPSQITVDSPYNTYTHKGLPPGPIDSPGEATIRAALNPAVGDWLYFVTSPKTGVSTFVNTETEFDALVRQCKAEGGCR